MLISKFLCKKLFTKPFLLPGHQLAENLIIVFGFYEMTKKRYINEFVIKFLGIIVTIIVI